MPQSFALGSVESNSSSRTCDCLAHRFGNAVDGPQRLPRYGSDMTETEWQVVRASLPIRPGWRGGATGRRVTATW
ncbi:hypothetical protein SGFS_002720 [Streptomyces graminofaciens]|uniref:Transposase n=1 Tax=Streptomyces graminofaciens TaxID=68212 RepID=A0ABM7EZW0_9ACTN|nr:hypothetical protein SGFS_002720 [Streptomyces graminofaciens]